MTWVNSKFKKKIEVKSGYTWSGDQELYENREGSTAVLRVSNIQDTLELDDILYLINVSEQHKLDKKISKNWTIAVNSNGNRNRVGKGIFIEEDMEFLFASFLVAFKPFDENEIDPRYFYYWYSSETVQKRISAIAEGTTGLSNLELRYLKSQDIYHPASIIEQRFIANTINAVDKTIQATKNSIAKLENLKTSLMQNLLTGKMKPDGSWRSEDEFWIDDKFGKVPNGWVVSNIGSFGELKTGKTPPTADEKNFSLTKDIQFVTPGDVDDSVYILDTERYVSTQGLRFSNSIPKDSVCFISIGSTIGKIAITTELCCTNQQINSIIPDENNYFLFVYYQTMFNSPRIKSIAGVTATPQINKSDLSKFKLIKPDSFDEQKLIGDKLITIDDCIVKKQETIKRFDSLKKSLMQNLLTGKVRLPQEALKQ